MTAPAPAPATGSDSEVGGVAPSMSARARGRARRLLLGRAGAPRWERPALIALLLGTGLLYIWNLSANGWGNAFYAAAAQAGATDWIAFLYGSSDAANSITVDKPPASIWVMALSVRIFGLSEWSVLLPQALMGVATVGVVYAMVRPRFGAGAALVSGAAVALTPAATLMFRFDNPDALLVLLVSLAAFFTLRGLDDGRMRWVLAAGAMIGLAFLTKQLQAFLLLPALATVYLWAAPRPFLTRLGHSFAALGAVVVAAGWWVAIVELVPAEWRPYIGGSPTNSFLELTFGYNGLGRLTGDDTGGVGLGGGPGAALLGGEIGIARMFSDQNAGLIAWLLPAALVLAVVGLVLTRREPRTSARRGILVLATGWLLVTGLAFSFMSGIFHSYYLVALGPPIGILVGAGAAELWRRRERIAARATLAAVILGTAAWAWVLLARGGDPPALRVVVALAAVAAAVLLLLPPRGPVRMAIAGGLALAAVLAGPAANSLETAATPVSGALPGGLPPGGGQLPGGGPLPFPGGGLLPGGQDPGGQDPGGMPPGGPPGPGGVPGGGGIAALLGTGEVSDELAATLAADAESYTWVAAAVGSNKAAGYQLATEHPVMPLGGFNGSDPSPTLADFQRMVADGEIHWFIGGESFFLAPNRGPTESADITAWVEEEFEFEEIDGVPIYDLTP